MKIVKFIEFIKEELSDTPETFVMTLLKKLKSDIDRMFDFQENTLPGQEMDNEQKPEEVKKIKKISKKSKDKMSFEDLGIRLESSEISKYSKLHDSLTVKFSDDKNTYTLIIMVDSKDAIPKDPSKDFTIDDIEKCYIKFKKYDLDTFDVIGQISKNVEVKKIDEEFLIDLKIEIDEQFGDESEEEFEIETE
jgi:hypothetical protein